MHHLDRIAHIRGFTCAPQPLQDSSVRRTFNALPILTVCTAIAVGMIAWCILF